MPYLAALTPPDWEVTLCDDAIEEPYYDRPFDVVAMTVRTVTSLRVYEIADRFRKKGFPFCWAARMPPFIPRKWPIMRTLFASANVKNSFP